MTASSRANSREASPLAVIAHPSPDRYGSDKAVLESAQALMADGWSVLVVVPHDGPLLEELHLVGAAVRVLPFPVLRKSQRSVRGVLRLGAGALRASGPLLRLLREQRPALVYVNTLTVPLWPVVARLSSARVLCHVHEAEEQISRVARLVLLLPLLLSHRIVVNSIATERGILGTVPRVAPRISLIYNGILAPEVNEPLSEETPRPLRLVFIGRLSPRKGPDVAIAALELLVQRGHDARLLLAGSTFTGYEWYERTLRRAAAAPAIEGRVTFSGYRSDIAKVLGDADLVVVPSRLEPFGNVAVEAMMAMRPLVVSDVQGLTEIVDNEQSGVLVRPNDPAALANAVELLLQDWPRAVATAKLAGERAHERFSCKRYAEELRSVVRATVTTEDRDRLAQPSTMTSINSRS